MTVIKLDGEIIGVPSCPLALGSAAAHVQAGVISFLSAEDFFVHYLFTLTEGSGAESTSSLYD